MNKDYRDAMNEWTDALHAYTRAGGKLLAPMRHTDPAQIRSAAQSLRIATRALEQQVESKL